MNVVIMRDITHIIRYRARFIVANVSTGPVVMGIIGIIDNRVIVRSIDGDRPVIIPIDSITPVTL